MNNSYDILDLLNRSPENQVCYTPLETVRDVECQCHRFYPTKNGAFMHKDSVLTNGYSKNVGTYIIK